MNLFNNEGADKMVTRKETCMIDCTPGTCFCESAKAEQAPCGDVDELLADMRRQVSWTTIAKMPIPLYKRMKIAIQAMRPAESASIRACGQVLDEEALLSAIEHCDALDPDDVRGAVQAYLQAAKPEQPDTLVEQLEAEKLATTTRGRGKRKWFNQVILIVKSHQSTIRSEAVSPEREAGNEFFRKTFLWNTQPITAIVQRQKMREPISSIAGDVQLHDSSVHLVAMHSAPESKAKDEDFERRLVTDIGEAIRVSMKAWGKITPSVSAEAVLRAVRQIAKVTSL